jgi:hypothetical protein
LEYYGVSVKKAVLTTYEELHVRNEKVGGLIPLDSTITLYLQSMTYVSIAQAFAAQNRIKKVPFEEAIFPFSSTR